MHRIAAIFLCICCSFAASSPHPITIDYPVDGSVFPPDFAAPTFIWRDGAESVRSWAVEVKFASGRTLRAESAGTPMKVGHIDPRCVGPTNKLPELSSEQAAAHTWKPDPQVWEEIKRGSLEHPAVVSISGYSAADPAQPVSRGRVTVRTSVDPVGAPVFYRDVPLMPSEVEKGVIKPIPPKMLPFVAWRLRYVGEPESRLLLEDLHTCANCHSFSADGKTLGMDLDGPHNDKSLYALAPVAAHVSISDRDVISWKTFRDQVAPDKRIGFMSQVSPDGRYVVTATQVEYHVANFPDYRFLQVFYPTRGILAYYDRARRRVSPLPGADDPSYVQANAVWSPDGSYLVFARARATESYPKGRRMPEFAGDPNELQIRYDLYRIPFNEGRGGVATPIAGASDNGMSNSFPKISPDGRWLVFVKARNGQLMRPDGELYIVPAIGGEARRMRCNTRLMNSWHSFSPNGRWMVFSSKSRSPYTQLFLTHIGEQGDDSPAILLENTTAANRAANIPEFVNVPPGGLAGIEVPAAEFYRLYDSAWELMGKGEVAAAIAAWNRALLLDPNDARARNNFAALLLRVGKVDEAIGHLRRVLEAKPDMSNARNNLAVALLQQGHTREAVTECLRSLEYNPDSGEAHTTLGNAYLMQGKLSHAVTEWRAALNINPDLLPVLSNVAWTLATCPEERMRNGAEAIGLAERGVKLTGGNDPRMLGVLGAAYAESGRYADAVATTRRALSLAAVQKQQTLRADLESRIALFEAKRPFRDGVRGR